MQRDEKRPPAGTEGQESSGQALNSEASTSSAGCPMCGAAICRRKCASRAVITEVAWHLNITAAEYVFLFGDRAEDAGRIIDHLAAGGDRSSLLLGARMAVRA